MWVHEKEWEKEWGENPDTEPDERWAGPKHTAFPCNMLWMLGVTEVNLGALTIKKMTQEESDKRMLPPPAEAAWRARM